VLSKKQRGELKYISRLSRKQDKNKKGPSTSPPYPHMHPNSQMQPSREPPAKIAKNHIKLIRVRLVTRGLPDQQQFAAGPK
jgi:hypothetical protein